jgi:predicted PurR-regulated permease PerM
MAHLPFAADLPGWLQTLLGIYLVVGSLLGIGFILAVIVAYLKIKAFVSRISRQMEQVSTQVRSTADHVTSTVNSFADRAQRIGDTVESTVRQVAHKIDVLTDLLRDAVASPIINASSFAAGVRKGVEAWLERRRARREPPE